MHVAVSFFNLLATQFVLEVLLLCVNLSSCDLIYISRQGALTSSSSSLLMRSSSRLRRSASRVLGQCAIRVLLISCSLVRSAFRIVVHGSSLVLLIVPLILSNSSIVIIAEPPFPTVLPGSGGAMPAGLVVWNVCDLLVPLR